MFSSIFSTAPPVDPKAPNLHPVTDSVKDGQYFGQLTSKDTEWLAQNSGFVTETQTFYVNTDDGKSIMCQVIHSAVGVWYPTIQFNCKIYDPATKSKVWKSINVSNFVTPPPGLDKRSSKADQFSITHKTSTNEEYPESYAISANLGRDLQLHLELARPASVPGWKVGAGEKGGYSYFGPDVANPEGYVIHRFWPRFKTTGHFVAHGAMSTVTGPGMFVHAIQGMRPNLVASAWNFANFQSKTGDRDVSAILMEFTTTDSHGKQGAGSGFARVNVGSLVVDGKLVSVTSQTHYRGEDSKDTVIAKALHTKTVHDEETGYNAPTELQFDWAGPSLIADKPGTYTGKLTVDVGDAASPKGLIEKVDVLAEIPYVIKMAVNYVAGTKPYIYQWYNPTKVSITAPDGEVVEIDGTFYNEASFIS